MIPAGRAGLRHPPLQRRPRRRLVLGGVTLDGPGLAGHSDADVVAHAVADALLGAAGLGDIGTHFPDTDPAYAGVDSMELLARVVAGSHGRLRDRQRRRHRRARGPQAGAPPRRHARPA